MLDIFMKQLCRELELEAPLEPQMPGVYSFPLEEGLSIAITDLPQGFALSCTIGPIPKAKQEEFFSQMLLANLFGQGTRGAILGLDEEGNLMKLSKTVIQRVEYREFRDILEDFINAVDFWREESLTR